ncbi:MAG: ABC transporter ATP-binding protein [Deltaproteobacteria bacterium]|nr:ABC transporter ATP-binding protein [Deltaproteobacteria bacterium]MBI4374097.1 ABC transporter ATP-binding protein [Deltaproteobacteria bacterium]
MKNQIELEGVEKVYRTNGLPIKALTDVSLGFAQGEFAVLAGPSGSGKSTLLNLIGALDRPTSGVIRVGGEDLSLLSARKLSDFRLRKIGFVFQAYNLIPVLTALENVEYILLLQGADAKERRKRSVALLERVGLCDQIHKLPGEMSGGQQQRVAVARALASHPEMILADEPTANLDSTTGSALIDLFRELNEQFQTTFIFASHDPMVIQRAERVVRLKDGHVES